MIQNSQGFVFPFKTTYLSYDKCGNSGKNKTKENSYYSFGLCCEKTLWMWGQLKPCK